MRFQTGNEDQLVYTNLAYGWQNYYYNDGKQFGGSEEAFTLIRDYRSTNSESAMGQTIKRSKGLFKGNLEKLKTTLETRLTNASTKTQGSEWGFHKFTYFNMTSTNLTSGDPYFNKIVSGDASDDEEEEAFEFRKRKESEQKRLHQEVNKRRNDRQTIHKVRNFYWEGGIMLDFISKSFRYSFSYCNCLTDNL